MKPHAAPRLVLGASSLSIWDSPFLRKGEEADLRAFLAGAFSLPGIRSAEIDRARGLSRLRYEAGAEAAGLWRGLGRVLRSGAPGGGAASAEALFLEAPGPLRVRRIGGALTSFRLRADERGRLRIGHPLLRSRPGMRARLEEELAAAPEVSAFRHDPFTGDFLLRLEARDRAAETLALALERSWPRLLEGLEGPPSDRRFLTAGALLGVSLAASTVAPGLLPVAVAGVAAYGAPNALAALRDLRRGRVGLPALYASGWSFFLATRSPLTSSILAVLTQLWPRLARNRALEAQRAALAPWRRRPRSAWLVLAGGEEIEAPAESLRPGDLIVLRRGETVAADGRIERGFVAAAPAGSPQGARDKEPGERLKAGDRILDGEAFLRVERAAAESQAALVAASAPQGLLKRSPYLDAAERIANRNARPVLALAWGNLLATGVLRRSQGILRPDYATAPRLSARLSAQRGFIEALRGGALLHRPEALERLAEARIFVFDESAPLLARPLEIAGIEAQGAREDEISAWLAAGLEDLPDRAAHARKKLQPRGPIRRRAGSLWFEDRQGRRIELASGGYLAKIGLAQEAPAGTRPSVWVLRDGKRVGRVDFREGAARPAREALEALRASPGPALRLVYLSGAEDKAAEAFGAALGVDFARGGLTPEAKADLIRSFGQPAVWVGDGAAPASAPSIAASHASFSTAEASGEDAAEALLLSGLSGLVAARTAARRHRAAVAGDYRLIYATNLLALGGAFRFGFSGFQSGLLSNLGTAAIYARHARSLRRLTAEQDRRDRIAFREFST